MSARLGGNNLCHVHGRRTSFFPSDLHEQAALLCVAPAHFRQEEPSSRAQQGGSSAAASSKESSPPPARESSGSQAQADGGEADPWASLQSKYKIGERGSAGAGGPRVPPLPTKRVAAAFDDDDEDDVVVLDAGRTSDCDGRPTGRGGGGGGYATPTAIKLAARAPPPPQASAQARGGGWGNGNMAAAGTLMLGDEVTTAPTAAAATRHPGGLSRYDEDEEEENTELEVPHSDNAAARGGGARQASYKSDDLGMEEFDDVDALLAEEMRAAGLNDDLAAKLARLEAALGVDDD